MARRGDRGFTLVELLIVVVVLGILAAVVVVAMGAFTSEASTRACDADRRTLEQAAQIYLAEHGGVDIPETGTGQNKFERTLVESGLLAGYSSYFRLNRKGEVKLRNLTNCT